LRRWLLLVALLLCLSSQRRGNTKRMGRGQICSVKESTRKSHSEILKKIELNWQRNNKE
jgi:hypothetical protein